MDGEASFGIEIGASLARLVQTETLCQVLEPLLQGFSKAGETALAGSDNPDTALLHDGTLSDASEPSEGVASADGSGNGDNSGDGMVGDGNEGGEFCDTRSIGDDIAALEAELLDEVEELFDMAKGDGDGTLASHLPGGKEESVRKAAWCLFEVLLPRCVGLEGQGLETRLEEPTSFSHRFVEADRDRLFGSSLTSRNSARGRFGDLLEL